MQRPDKKNALSIQLRDEIADALDDLLHDEELKVVVITGAGDVFSAGFDLREFDRALADEDFAALLWTSSDRYHLRVAGFPLPTIAAVNGPAIAGGMDLAVLCDFRVAADTAVFSHPEYTFGDVVYTPLADLVGGAWARELCMTGRAVDAREAESIRLVNRVAPAGEVVAASLELAATIAAGPRANLMRTKAKARNRGALPDGGTLDL
jgi:enoyl-CoA hydratase